VQAANVGGSVEVLRLAGTGRPKRVCHISTLSTVDINSRTGEELDDPAPLGEFEAMTTGYTRSKWVAEQLVAQAAARGLDVRTMRLGALAGHSRTGVSNPNDYAWLVVCACLAIGAVPLMRAPTSWLPVDLVAQATITLTAVPSSHYRPYQILPDRTPMPTSSAGCAGPATTYRRWRSRSGGSGCASRRTRVRGRFRRSPR
jgi:thioester reductase-like protein